VYGSGNSIWCECFSLPPVRLRQGLGFRVRAFVFLGSFAAAFPSGSQQFVPYVSQHCICLSEFLRYVEELFSDFTAVSSPAMFQYCGSQQQLSSEFGTHQRVTAGFWPKLSVKGP